MIPAAKGRWFNPWFSRVARGRIEGAFGRVLVAGLDGARAATDAGPVLGVLNHSTWWDALVVLWLSEILLGVDGYALMDAENLRRLPFFTRVGAFGVDLADPRDGARSIRYAVRLLSAPRKAVWVFPEGRERSPFEPLELQAGAAQMARVAKKARVMPVALRYVFGERDRPDLFVSFGDAAPGPRDAMEGVLAQKRGLEAELARIHAAVARRDISGFTTLHEHPPSRLGGLAERMLARLFPLGPRRSLED
jgi:1-acyl-sn-glycerol-3-phosphate acyltransferase